MKKINIYTLLVLTTLTLFAFKNRLLNSEEIIPCQEITLGCLILGREIGGIGGKHIIKNNTEYQKLIMERSTHSNCGNYQLPIIDFNQYTLIGYVSSVAGCDFPEVTHEIKKTNNNYSVHVNITQIGLCERNNPVTFWCLIPKIEENAIFNFDVKTTW